MAQAVQHLPGKHTEALSSKPCTAKTKIRVVDKNECFSKEDIQIVSKHVKDA
jgi:hypothetical protein